VRTTTSRTGSICETLDEYSLATHTEPAATAIEVGPLPTGIVAATESVAGSIRDTVESRLFATQTAPRPTASDAGPFSTRTSPADTLSNGPGAGIDAPDAIAQNARDPSRATAGSEHPGSTSDRHAVGDRPGGEVEPRDRACTGVGAPERIACRDDRCRCIGNLARTETRRRGPATARTEDEAHRCPRGNGCSHSHDGQPAHGPSRAGSLGRPRQVR